MADRETIKEIAIYATPVLISILVGMGGWIGSRYADRVDNMVERESRTVSLLAHVTTELKDHINSDVNINNNNSRQFDQIYTRLRSIELMQASRNSTPGAMPLPPLDMRKIIPQNP